MNKLLLAGVTALALAATPAVAQHHGGRPGGGPHVGGGMHAGMPMMGGGHPGDGNFGRGPGPGYVGRAPGHFGPGAGVAEHFGPGGPVIVRPHRRVFIGRGPGWIWCDEPAWYGSPWWGEYCGEVYDYYYDY
jgi:hypothetical protein